MTSPFKVWLARTASRYNPFTKSASGKNLKALLHLRKREARTELPGVKLRRWSRGQDKLFSGVGSLFSRPWGQCWRAQQGTAAIEFAMVILPFLMMLIFIFALGLHFFYQELLDSALHTAVRQVQTGNAQNLANSSSFNSSYLCPAAGNMLTCANFYVNVQKVTFSGTQDFYNSTTGALPGSFTFCNPGPSEFILYTAVYAAPSFTGALLPNVFSAAFKGSQTDAIMSQVATYTENYTALAATPSAAAAC